MTDKTKSLTVVSLTNQTLLHNMPVLFLHLPDSLLCYKDSDNNSGWITYYGNTL